MSPLWSGRGDGRASHGVRSAAALSKLAKLRKAAGDEACLGDRYEDAAELFRALIEAPAFPEFLTLPAYEMITADVG